MKKITSLILTLILTSSAWAQKSKTKIIVAEPKTVQVNIDGKIYSCMPQNENAFAPTNPKPSRCEERCQKFEETFNGPKCVYRTSCTQLPNGCVREKTCERFTETFNGSKCVSEKTSTVCS